MSKRGCTATLLKIIFLIRAICCSTKKNYVADGIGVVGSPACGDLMALWIKVVDGRINECKWRTFGCASAIASTSMLSVMATEEGGMTLARAKKLRPRQSSSGLEASRTANIIARCWGILRCGRLYKTTKRVKSA